jgi:hypothetical protein
MIATKVVWPELPYPAWRDTAMTLQLWTQIIGKVRLGLTPWVNHSWHVALYVSAHGLNTSPIPYGNEIFELELDFLEQRLTGRSSAGQSASFPLTARPVAEFHDRVFDLLRGLGVEVHIKERPNEIAGAIPFPQDRVHRVYDGGAALRFWRALVQVDRVFKLFRTSFLGKVSPVHFFWGSFDLAVTRFSGRKAPPHPGGVPGLPDAITREAYSHEVSSAGFWPGSDAFPQAAFYSYAYPEPPGLRERPVTAGARYDMDLKEFILPYDTVRTAANPDNVLLDFLSSTYAAAADAGKWDRAALECPLGSPARARAA